MPLRGAEIGIGAVGTVVPAVDRRRRSSGSTASRAPPATAKGSARSAAGLFARGRRTRRSRWCSRSCTRSRGGRTAASTFSVGTRVDGLVVMMLFVVTLISLLVHIYSVAYMREEVRFTHYYAMLSLFTASMLLLVVADNTLVLLVGWEGVGLCSFALIGHFWEEGANSGRGAQGVPHDPNRRHRLDDRHHHHVLRRGHLQHHGDQRVRAEQRRRPLAAARRRHLPVHRHHRQERPVPAAHLAARRHGRPHAGVRAHPRRDDGRRRRVPRRAPLPGVLRGLLDRAPAA